MLCSKPEDLRLIANERLTYLFLTSFSHPMCSAPYNCKNTDISCESCSHTFTSTKHILRKTFEAHRKDPKVYRDFGT